jgi:hypothetical protein
MSTDLVQLGDEGHWVTRVVLEIIDKLNQKGASKRDQVHLKSEPLAELLTSDIWQKRIGVENGGRVNDCPKHPTRKNKKIHYEPKLNPFLWTGKGARENPSTRKILFMDVT